MCATGTLHYSSEIGVIALLIHVSLSVCVVVCLFLFNDGCTKSQTSSSPLIIKLPHARSGSDRKGTHENAKITARLQRPADRFYTLKARAEKEYKNKCEGGTEIKIKVKRL